MPNGFRIINTGRLVTAVGGLLLVSSFAASATAHENESASPSEAGLFSETRALGNEDLSQTVTEDPLGSVPKGVPSVHIPLSPRGPMVAVFPRVLIVPPGEGGATAPEPQPMPGPFAVFFDFDSAKVGASQERIIAEAISALEPRTPRRIVLSGHADRAGPRVYNQSLSERRAQAVAAALKLRGVPAELIMTQAFGETRPIHSTEDGAPTVQNRVVVISFEE